MVAECLGLRCQISIPRSHSSMRRVQEYNKMPQLLTSNCYHWLCLVPHSTKLYVRDQRLDGTHSDGWHSNHNIVERCNADNHSDHTVSVHCWEFPQVLGNIDKFWPFCLMSAVSIRKVLYSCDSVLHQPNSTRRSARIRHG